MKELINKLRKAASCHPNNADLFLQSADALTVTQDRLDKANEQLSRSSLDHALSQNKIKAEAVDNFIGHLYLEAPYLDSDIRHIGNEFIGRIERGEL